MKGKKSTSDNAQIEENAEANLIKPNVNGLIIDEGPNSDKEEELKSEDVETVVKPNFSKLSITEKKKIINPSKPAPKRGDPL